MEIRRTGTFDTWLRALRDERALVRIVRRLDRLAGGNMGDVKPVGRGVSEMRVDYGPGYRIYFTHRGQEIIVLLCCGDKGSQDRDIRAARALVEEE